MAVKFFKFIIMLLAVSVSLAVLAVSVCALKGYNMYKAETDKVSPVNMAEMLRGENFVTADKLPEFYLNAVICTEDKRFYSHNGVDLRAVARAVANDIKTLSPEQGGSTLTQQLAKNFYFTQDKRLERKFAETFAALEIERSLSKKEILELYVNSIYFGSGYYGIYEAAEGYFGKEPSELTDHECAMLAGIPNAPSVYSPSENPALAEQRTKQVLDRMEECSLITAERKMKILNEKEKTASSDDAGEAAVCFSKNFIYLSNLLQTYFT